MNSDNVEVNVIRDLRNIGKDNSFIYPSFINPAPNNNSITKSLIDHQLRQAISSHDFEVETSNKHSGRPVINKRMIRERYQSIYKKLEL